MEQSLRKVSLYCALLAYMCVFVVQAQQVPNADDQCRILMNSTKATFCQSHDESLCSSIACRSSESSLCVSMSFGAANGTLCGANNMICENGECEEGTTNDAQDECIYGDDIVVNDGSVISDTLPAQQMSCPDVIAFLVKNNKSPFVYCSQPSFNRACCQTCKLYESFTCKDLYPQQCQSLTSSQCLSANTKVAGLGAIVACARTCKACSQPQLKCSAFLCENGGTCTDVSSSGDNSLIGFSCTCQPGYFGQFCELKNPCLPNPCASGECEISGTTGYQCKCPVGTSGPNCASGPKGLAMDVVKSVYPNPCYPNPCSGNAQCVLYTLTSYYCVCPPGYYGNLCQFSNGCFSNPCLNGGTCTSTSLWPNYYQCTCPNGYYGLNCQFCWITTTTTTIPPTTTTASNCVDSNPSFCYAVKVNGYCNTVYGQLCPLSCGLCCVDSQPSCMYWQSYCPQLIQLYPTLCRKTCGQC